MDAATRHLVQRLLADVDFLAQEGHLRPYQANTIRSQLKPLTDADSSAVPNPTDANPPPFSVATSEPVAAAPASTPVYRAPPPPTFQAAQQPKSSPSPSLASAARSKVPPPPPPAAAAEPVSVESDTKLDEKREPEKKKDLVKALWAFDASGGDDELRFDSGDTIEVLERVDENWWKGTVVGQPGGKEGLFPSNYVEPLIEPERAAVTAARVLPPAPADPQSAQHHWPAPTARFGSTSSPVVSPQPSGYGNEKGGYGYAPPYGQSSYGHPPPPPNADGTVAANGLQPADPEEQKKRADKFKKLGGKVGGAAAGGFGFGIGAGLASNLF